MTTPRAVLQLAAALLCLSPALWPTPAPPQERAPAAVPAEQEPTAAQRGPLATAQLATVLLVRHAEKGADDPRDPGLSARGVARAEALAALLARAGVTHLFTSEYRRTQATLAPLAARVGVVPVTRKAREVTQLATELRGLPAGSTAVVAGHSNTVPALARALGVELRDLVDSAAGKVLDEAIYDRVWVLTHTVGGAADAPLPHVVELTLQVP